MQSKPRKDIVKKAEVEICSVLHMNSLLYYYYHWQRHLERVAEKPMSSRYGKQLLDARSPKERTIPTVTWPLQDSIIVTSLCSALHPQCVTTCLFCTDNWSSILSSWDCSPTEKLPLIMAYSTSVVARSKCCCYKMWNAGFVYYSHMFL